METTVDDNRSSVHRVQKASADRHGEEAASVAVVGRLRRRFYDGFRCPAGDEDMVVSVAAGVCDALDLAHAKVAGAGRMGSRCKQAGKQQVEEDEMVR
ncbi:hypothetical protein GB937_008076 [Aspergillus fischeri]|nr:hypothetical protein GB937_008076 [Aspergillus fischeri]